MLPNGLIQFLIINISYLCKCVLLKYDGHSLLTIQLEAMELLSP